MFHLSIKKYDPSLVSNYRSVSLLSTIGKVMEKIIHKHRMFNLFKDNQVITCFQLPIRICTWRLDRYSIGRYLQYLL